MKDGLIKVCAANIEVSLAEVSENTNRIIGKINEAHENKAQIVVFPELCLSGYSCGDLFFQTKLLNDCLEGLNKITKATEDLDIISIVGLPFMYKGMVYNCGAVIYSGGIMGIVPKTFIPNYKEFYERRTFTPAPEENDKVFINGETVLFGKDILFKCVNIPGFTFAVEVCEDLWVPNGPSVNACLNGATIICNLSASNEVVGKEEYRYDLVRMQSAKCICGYIYTSSGKGESTQDFVFSGHSMIFENGELLKQNEVFSNETIYSEIDVERIVHERSKISTFVSNYDDYDVVCFDIDETDTEVTRHIDNAPFLPKEGEESKFCERVLDIQAQGLMRRITQVNSKTIVVGISGGLDSALAILVMARAMDKLGRDRKDIIAVSMPCFGTSKRTHSNAELISKALGVTFKEIDIKEATTIHLKNIGHDGFTQDVAYENAQARERTQILMDLGNMHNGLVIGTGDLSELALGFATYNGDHMSMYAVNASVPKTLVRVLVTYVANKSDDKLKDILLDIVGTPVSPELLPPKEGEITQVTEDIIGPYELHDFFLYNLVVNGFRPRKIYRLAKVAFNGLYKEETIKKWLKKFYYRFFSQQFKRSCMPDGPKVGPVSLSPRGGYRIPSDACSKDYIKEIDEL